MERGGDMKQKSLTGESQLSSMDVPNNLENKPAQVLTQLRYCWCASVLVASQYQFSTETFMIVYVFRY